MTTETILILIIILGGFLGFFWINKLKDENKKERQITNLENRLSEVISNQLKEVRGTVDGTSQSMHRQIESFTRETEKLRGEISQIQKAMENVSSFQEFFTSPKARGEWGEASLEHILKEYFPADFYKPQHMFESGEQVDAVLKLPNEMLLPIDSKFPFDNYRRMVSEKDEERKRILRIQFLKDAKKQITDISQKYILPSEGTVEFAIMYIPAEAVYYEINMNREIDIVEYARQKKVILASPNTIFLTLKAIEHWFRDTHITRKTQEIIKSISKIQKDSKILKEDFEKIGKHIKNASSAYEKSEKRFDMFSEKVEKLMDKEVGQIEQKEESQE